MSNNNMLRFKAAVSSKLAFKKEIRLRSLQSQQFCVCYQVLLYAL